MLQGQRAVRVVHLIHGLGLGGLEQLVVQLSARSRARGIDSSILALGEEGPVRALAEGQGVPVQRLSAGGMSLSAMAGIRKALSDRDADVLHAHDLGPWLNAVAARALRPKTQVMATFHEQRVPSGNKRHAASVAARLSRVLVACGDQVRDEIREWAPAGTQVSVIGNGVPLPAAASADERQKLRAELGLAEGEVAIGYIGGLREIKGPDKLLAAFLDRFRDKPQVQLVLVGTGPLEAQLRKAALGAANVKLTGLVVGASRLLPAFDLYAQPSLSEGRSLSMLDAMAAGLPTVAHDLPPVAEIHRRGESALLVPLLDAKALGEALDRLAADPALRARMGAAARERSKAFSIDGTVDAYAALYRELL